MASESPSSSMVGGLRDLSSRRMTTFSPSTVGSVATLMSSVRPTADAESVIRPSCGLRRSAMSSFASTFRRVVTPAAIFFGIRCTSRRTPSTRKRTASASSCGSKWTSEAFSSAAWKMSALTRRTSGPSEIPSSASRSSPSSSCLVHVDARRRNRSPPPFAQPLELGQDVVSGGDAEIERMLRREAKLVDGVQVPGIGDRDLEDVALERVRHRHGALERLHRDQLRRVDGDPDGMEVDDRKVVPDGQHAGDAVGGRDALVDQRLRDRRAVRPPAHGRARARRARREPCARADRG